MKFRSSFVSNSSSSSFVTIGGKTNQGLIDALTKLVEQNKGILDIQKEFGSRKFGWGPESLYDFGSRILWTFYQSQYADRDICDEPIGITTNKYLRMLERVIQKNVPNIVAFQWPKEWYDWDSRQYGYIDHQSTIPGGKHQEVIFEDKKTLEQFIFVTDSYITLDNDNY